MGGWVVELPRFSTRALSPVARAAGKASTIEERLSDRVGRWVGGWVEEEEEEARGILRER